MNQKSQVQSQYCDATNNLSNLKLSMQQMSYL